MSKGNQSESEFIKHVNCEECGSSDGNSLYTDGHQYCFVCDSYVPPTNEDSVKSDSEETVEIINNDNPFESFNPIYGDLVALKSRKITAATCKKYDYQVGRYNGQPVHICNVNDEKGRITGQQLRFADKTFKVLGKITASDIVGKHLFNGGKKLIITEGAIDMMSISQVQGNKYPVVSLALGAKSAKRAIASNLDWLKQFEELIIAFDNDEAGIKASDEAADILAGYMTVSFMKLPLKDADEMLVADRTEELIKAVWNTQPYKPDGLVGIIDLKAAMRESRVPKQGLPYWINGLNEKLYGRHEGQLILLGAGTGVGKTDFITQQMEYDSDVLGLDVCGYLLEQDPKETFKRVMGKLSGKRFHVPDNSWTAEEYDSALEHKALEKIELYNSFGVTSWDGLHPKLLYQVSRGKKLFYIDHLTALATGSDDRQEKEELEYVCAEMAAFAKRHSVIIIAISHLTTPDKGKSHEEGGRVTIRQFKGSRSIGFWSHIMLGLERNQQADNLDERQTTILRILKDRFTGQGTGCTIQMGYETETARLYEKTGQQVTDFSQSESVEDYF